MTTEPATPDIPGALAENTAVLAQQSATAAALYLHAAVTSIDETFGKGFAQAHPELIAGFRTTAAGDNLGGLLAYGMESIATAVNDPSSSLAFINTDMDDDAPTAHEGGMQ